MSMVTIAARALLAGALGACMRGDRPLHQGEPSHAELAALYEGGKTYVEFRDAATKRTEAWNEHHGAAHVPDALRTRVSSLPFRWWFLVVAEDWCGDSANTIPYVAKLVDVVDNLDLRIIDSEVGRAIMEAHRTPDGRAATPTVLLLTEDFREVGCWVERPAKLQQWVLENEARLDEEELLERKYAWYEADEGQETVAEMVRMIESAAASARGGTFAAAIPSCGALGPRPPR